MDNTLTNERTHTSSKTRILAQIGMLGAISVVLMLFEIPLPFAPAFYEIDFSEVPVLVGCFAMGPVAGAAIELIKILLTLQSTARLPQVLVNLLTSFSDVLSLYRQESFTAECIPEKVPSLVWLQVLH